MKVWLRRSSGAKARAFVGCARHGWSRALPELVAWDRSRWWNGAMDLRFGGLKPEAKSQNLRIQEL